MTIKEIVQSFYEGLVHKNDEWQINLAQDIKFSDVSKNLYAEKKDAFVQSFKGFLRAVENIPVKQLIEKDTIDITQGG